MKTTIPSRITAPLLITEIRASHSSQATTKDMESRSHTIVLELLQMDQETLDAYDREAATFAANWHAQPMADDLQAAVRQFFRPGPTADIGCGSRRDTAWLDRHGFPAIGYDPSQGLLAQARRRYSAIRFRQAALPELDGIEARSFTNVLCETVIMHLAPATIPASIRRLLAILEPCGTLYLSWRVADGGDRRDGHGRLYVSFDPGLVLSALTPAEVLLDEQVRSVASGKVIRRMVARKSAPAV
jgi:ubiquinone/menaquinone biosynthesis C-methylase UbiE